MKTHRMKKGSLVIGIAIAIMAMFTMGHQAEAQKTSNSISTRNGVTTYTTKNGSERLELEIDGRIEFADDDKSIKSISNNGYIRIRSTARGEKREILAEAGRDGTIEYDYYEGRRRADFEGDGEKWLADILIDVIRSTGIGAEARVERIYAKGGVDGVLNEVSEIRGDYASHIYLEELLYIKELNDKDLVKIAGYVPKELNSDYYISEVFKDHGDRFLKSDESTEAFLSAMKRMSSDYYVSQILSDVMRQELSDKSVDMVLSNLENMDSDYYKASIIKDVFRNDLSKNQLMSLLSSTEEISSDYYKSDVLKGACRLVGRSDDEVKSSFRKAARGIRSDYYYGSISRCID